MAPKKNLKNLIPLTTEQVSNLSQPILNVLWPRKYGSVSILCSHMASLLHDSALT